MCVTRLIHSCESQNCTTRFIISRFHPHTPLPSRKVGGGGGPQISKLLKSKNECVFSGFRNTFRCFVTHLVVSRFHRLPPPPSPKGVPRKGEGRGRGIRNLKTAEIQKRMRFQWFPQRVSSFRDFWSRSPPPLTREGNGGRGTRNFKTAEI